MLSFTKIRTSDIRRYEEGWGVVTVEELDARPAATKLVTRKQILQRKPLIIFV